jgi:hypothetical protein
MQTEHAGTSALLLLAFPAPSIRDLGYRLCHCQVMENITALGQKFVPEVIVVEESPQSQEPGSSLAPPKDLVIRDFPSCQHTAFAVILQWELVLLCHEIRPCPVKVLDVCLHVKIRHSDE